MHDVDLVFGIQREVVVDQQSAARAQRQAFDVVVLSAVRRRSVDLRHGNERRIADGHGADLARRGEILLEQRRRNLQYVRDVVEAVAFVVGRQQFFDVDFKVEQIANRIAVFRAIQAVKRRSAGIGMRCGGLVQPCFEQRDHRFDRGLIRLGAAQRRHHSCSAASSRPFPRLRRRRECR